MKITKENLILSIFLSSATLFILWAIQPQQQPKEDNHAEMCANVRAGLTLTPSQIAKSMLIAYRCN
jgi:hypothetical protein